MKKIITKSSQKKDPRRKILKQIIYARQKPYKWNPFRDLECVDLHKFIDGVIVATFLKKRKNLK